MPAKSMDRDQYVGLYAGNLPSMRVKEAKYREFDNVVGRDAKFTQTLPHIPNVSLSTSGRKHFSPEGVFGVAPHYLLEERFI